MTYYVSSGVTSTGITLSYDAMYISSGGVANSTIVNSDGWMYISPGGGANSITVNSGGYMFIYFGGVANSTTVNSGGSMRIFSGGTATNVIWTPCVGNVYAADGAYVTYVSKYSGVYFGSNNQLLSHTQTMTGKIVSGDMYGRGDMYVMDGGGANSTNVNDWGYMCISSGGVANSTAVNSGGSMRIFSGGVANSTNVNESGYMYIASGGVASAIIENGGWVDVEEGADVTFASNTIAGVTISYVMTVHKNTIANSTTVNSYGSMHISSGGVANSTTVNDWGEMYISSGGVANSTIVNSGGYMDIHSGGVANNTIVNSRGHMYIASGGTATNVIWTPCVGDVCAADGAYVTYVSKYSGVYFGSDNQLLSHTQTMTGKIVSIHCSMYVMGGGVANSTTVNDWGDMYISSGGVANSTNVNSNGSMFISSGGGANSTNVNYGGWMHISSGGIANSTTVKSGGYMDIYSGGTATNVIWTPCVGGVYAADGAYVTYVSKYSGVYFGSNNQLLSHTQTMTGKIVSGGMFGRGDMYVMDGGVANSTIVNDGYMYISSGGVANSTIVNDGYMYISSGGVANSTNVNYGGSMYIYSGGVANSTNVNYGGWMHISSGGVANSTNVNYGGFMYIASGGVASAIIENGGWVDVKEGADVTFASNTIAGVTISYVMTVHKNTIANSTNVNEDGYMYISSGGVANNTNVNSDGWMVISGGVADSTNVNSSGYMSIASGGVADSTNVNSSGYMYISSGGVHRGSLQMTTGAVVSAYSGSVIDFTLIGRTASDDHLINDLSLISGAPTYTITVSADQATGKYKLAQGAANFTGTITIGDGTVEYGALTVNGDALFCNNRNYILKQNDGNLTLDIFNALPENLRGSADGLQWQGTGYAEKYQIGLAESNSSGILILEVTDTQLDLYAAGARILNWQVAADNDQWVSGDPLVLANAGPQKFIADENGSSDLFMASGRGIWAQGYAANHQGCKGDWNGTGEQVGLSGKNKLEDIFVGSNDANILVLTDDVNGDALFVDDIYSAFPADFEAQSRIAQIKEIRAGAGDDIVDMTSQRFVYVGDGLTVYGGLGNDVIWANSGENCLFGDAGNDRIVGGSDNDIIVGGAGNDSMHGGGGADTFCFGSAWGFDTVEQLAGGSVTLWFESGSEDFWNAGTMTYNNGVNSVTVKGVLADAVTLKFGDVETAIAGAFENAASEKVFEDKDKALIA